MKEINIPELDTISYSATEKKRFHREISIGNHVPLKQYLEELDNQLCELGEEEYMPIRVITGLELSTLVGFGGSMANIVFTDGLIEQTEYVPEHTDCTKPYIGMEVVEHGNYVAWIGPKEVEGRHSTTRFALQTPLKAPAFRKMIDELSIDLQNIKFFCEYWGPR